MKKLAISGASGFVGTALQNHFKNDYEVVTISQKDYKNNSLKEKLKDAEIVINLSGANIISRWTKEYKKVLYSSRIDTTKALVEAMKENPPKVFFSTSAIGIYKNDQTYYANTKKYGNNFLANLCKDWEKEAFKAKEFGVRTLVFRFGVVLGKEGGALKKMLLPFKMGVGGVIGDGKQAFSFISIEDLKRFYSYAIEKEKIEGVFNMVTPKPTTNYGLTKALGKTLYRPTLFPLPIFVLKALFGEGATVLTDGQKVMPNRVLDSGFVFKNQTIEDVLESILK